MQVTLLSWAEQHMYKFYCQQDRKHQLNSREHFSSCAIYPFCLHKPLYRMRLKLALKITSPTFSFKLSFTNTEETFKSTKRNRQRIFTSDFPQSLVSCCKSLNSEQMHAVFCLASNSSWRAKVTLVCTPITVHQNVTTGTPASN